MRLDFLRILQPNNVSHALIVGIQFCSMKPDIKGIAKIQNKTNSPNLFYFKNMFFVNILFIFTGNEFVIVLLRYF